jgi:hypothetical protein
MAPRPPNYNQERLDRERAKARKQADKADAKRELRERARAEAEPPKEE